MIERMRAPALWGLILIAVGLASLSGDAQVFPSAAYPQVSEDAYEHILDEVFAYKEPTARLQYSFVLRFMTSKHAESEVVLFALGDGTAQGNLFQVTGPSAWTIANDYIQKTGSTDVRQIARQVQAVKTSLSIPPDQAGLWYSGLLRSINQSTVQLHQAMVTHKKTGKTTIFLDGSTYECWFDQGLTDTHWKVMDEEVDNVNPAGHSFVAKWMNEVRRYALSHSAK